MNILPTKTIVTALTLLLNYPSLVFATTTSVPNINNPLAIAQSNSLGDNLIVPGERAGLVTRETTYQDLVKLYGRDKLVSKQVNGPEGEGVFPATQVNLGSRSSFTVVWNASKTKPLYVTDFGSAWQTSDKIGLGTSFAQLSNLCGEFQVTGLYWDYGNNVLFKENSRCFQSLRGLSLYVDAAPQAQKKFPKDLEAVMGDQTLSSTNPHWRNLEMRVISMKVYFPSNE